MRIAQLAPLWETVPPKAYGGTELIVYNLCEEFIKLGHEVTLFASGDSKTSANLEKIIDGPMRALKVTSPIQYELSSISRLVEKSGEFDIIHNHMGYQFLPFVELTKVPVVTTLHGAFVVDDEVSVYKKYKDQNYISISNSQRKGAPDLNYVDTVYNGIELEKFKFNPLYARKTPYLAFLGRMSEEKGPHLAIKLSKECGIRLIMAGKVDKHDIEHFNKKVKPLIDNEKIIFIGELGHEDKVKLLSSAYATVHPVTWPEPFGLVMIESMACGTPVLALNQGSIPEVIAHGKTGFVENSLDKLVKRVKDIAQIDRMQCRKHVEENFSAKKMANNYLSAYKKFVNKKNTVINMNQEINLKQNFKNVNK